MQNYSHQTLTHLLFLAPEVSTVQVLTLPSLLSALPRQAASAMPPGPLPAQVPEVMEMALLQDKDWDQLGMSARPPHSQQVPPAGATLMPQPAQPPHLHTEAPSPIAHLISLLGERIPKGTDLPSLCTKLLSCFRHNPSPW